MLSILNSPYVLRDFRAVNPRMGEIIQKTKTHCWCGESLHQHKRCLGCGILVGEGHETKSLDQGFCWSCRRRK